jgi:class 3 adenylate cyclase
MTSPSNPPRLRLDVLRADRVLHSSPGPVISIGRDPACHVRLSDPHVSQRHGEIVFTGQRPVYRDLKSRNGSEIRRGAKTIRLGPETGHQCPLEDGDELRLGNPLDPIALRIRLAAPASPSEQPTRLESEPPPPPAPAPREPPPPAPKEPAPVEKKITRFNRFDDIETIRGRLGDDNRALRCLYNLLGRLTAVRDRDEMLQAMARLLFESFDVATHVTVYLGPRQPAASSDLVPAVPPGDLQAEKFTPVLAVNRTLRASSPTPLSHVLFERISGKGEALLFEDAWKSFPGSKSLVLSRVRSGLAVPLRGRAGIRGILQIDNRTVAGVFTALDLDLATLIGNHVALLLANIEMYQDLEHLNRDLCDALMRVRLLDTAKDHLARFVPEAVRQIVDKSPASPRLDMVDSDATILFLDIGGYTKLTEKLDRDAVSYLVERYFSAFIDEIYKYHGDINETAGDGLMIIFRSEQPLEHARAAVSAALAIRRKTREINGQLRGESPPIDVNMGINTGTVLLGSRRIQGITGARWTYTATGMVTNVTARLAAHAVEGQIMIGGETAKRVTGAAVLKDRGLVQFKNVAQPLPVFEVLDAEAAAGAGVP